MRQAICNRRLHLRLLPPAAITKHDAPNDHPSDPALARGPQDDARRPTGCAGPVAPKDSLLSSPPTKRSSHEIQLSVCQEVNPANTGIRDRGKGRHLRSLGLPARRVVCGKAVRIPNEGPRVEYVAPLVRHLVLFVLVRQHNLVRSSKSPNRTRHAE